MKILKENRKQIGDILQQCKENANNLVHTCFVCQRVYVHASGLERHMESHRTEHQSNQEKIMTKSIETTTVKMVNSVHCRSVRMIKCLVCGQIFVNQKMCFKHLKSAHPEFGFNSDDGNFEIESMNDDTLTFEQVTIDLVLKCEFCDGLFMEMPALHQHELNHDVSIGYECSNCEVASRNLRFILSHRNNECQTNDVDLTKTEVYFVCSTCDDTFASLTQLYEHRFVFSNKKLLFDLLSVLELKLMLKIKNKIFLFYFFFFQITDMRQNISRLCAIVRRNVKNTFAKSAVKSFPNWNRCWNMLKMDIKRANRMHWFRM